MRKVMWSVIGVLATVAIVVGLLVFEPWRAFTSSELNEPLVGGAASTVLAKGAFVSQEHDTSGSASVIERADGSRVLRVQDLAGSDGPDLHVWLSDAKAGDADWGAYDDGRYVPLGELKATHGGHNYVIPADANLAGMRSVVIWCDRFSVAFGSAPLDL